MKPQSSKYIPDRLACQRQLDCWSKRVTIRAKPIDPKDSPGNMPWIYTIWSRSEPKLLCVFASP